MAQRPIRLGVVGGRRGAAFNLALEHLKGRVQLTAVCDLSAEVLETWRTKHPGVATYQDFDRLLKDDVCDAVFLATPMHLHATQAVAALDAGKHVVSEVIACITHEEAVSLIEAVERTGLTYMMAENYTYMRPHMMVRHMVEQGVFGELTFAEGMYLHDCRSLKFNKDGSLTWRGQLVHEMAPANSYPTHSFGPIAQWLDIGRTDQIENVYCAATPGLSMADYAERRFGADHPGAELGYWKRGDAASCLVNTRRGRVISLRFDSTSGRPHHMNTHELQGTRACFRTQTTAREPAAIWIDGRSPGDVLPPEGKATNPQWESLYDYADEFEHPRWKQWGETAMKAGHGGGDFFVLEDFVNAIQGEAPNPIDVYDAVTWSSILWLSEESIRTRASVKAIDYRALGKTAAAPAGA